MSAKTVFISSTYKDLKDHRREVWETLEHFDVSVRGMERFGARTQGALETCLAEVEQSDVYVGIIAYRLGSIDPKTEKPFTLLEYERASELKKEILIYVADDEAASFPRALMDEDTQTRERLQAFKDMLRERHTVATFSTPEDLAAKLAVDFEKHFSPKRLEENQARGDEDVFAQTAGVLQEFRLTPKRYNGREVRLRVQFYSDLFPASRKLCQQFNLSYGFTVGGRISIERPADTKITAGFSEIYATGNRIDVFRKLVQAKEADLHAQLQFTEEDVEGVEAEFLGRSYYYYVHEPEEDSGMGYVQPEGKVILLFTKPASPP